MWARRAGAGRGRVRSSSWQSRARRNLTLRRRGDFSGVTLGEGNEGMRLLREEGTRDGLEGSGNAGGAINVRRDSCLDELTDCWPGVTRCLKDGGGDTAEAVLS